MPSLSHPFQLRSCNRSLNTSSKSPSPKPKHSPPVSIALKNKASTYDRQQSQASSASSSRTPDLKSINAFTVSQASAGGMRGRMPPRMKTDTLSPEYRAAARKVTLAMISAPIAIVLSYYLAMRVWGGAEQKTTDGLRKKEDT